MHQNSLASCTGLWEHVPELPSFLYWAIGTSLHHILQNIHLNYYMTNFNHLLNDSNKNRKVYAILNLVRDV
jgi:hypothetical protein